MRGIVWHSRIFLLTCLIVASICSQMVQTVCAEEISSILYDNETAKQSPFIEGTHVSGWDEICQALSVAESGAIVEINTQGISVIPAAVFQSIKGRGVTAVITISENVIWKINGLDVTDKELVDVDLGVSFSEGKIPKSAMDDISGEAGKISFSINHEGEFGFTAKLLLYLGAENAGKIANLFYYDKTQKALNYVNGGAIEMDGYSCFTCTHASDYLVVVNDRALTNISDEATPFAGGSIKTQNIVLSSVLIFTVLILVVVTGVKGRREAEE